MKYVRPRVWTSIVLDFFRNVNLPLSVTLRCFTSDVGRVSAFPHGMTCSPNSEATVPDDDDAVVEERESRRPRRTRVRREEKARLTSAGVSVSVSADERGESTTAMGKSTEGWGIAPDCSVCRLQRGNGMERPRGEDGADAGGRVGIGDSGPSTSNETCRTGSGLGTDSVFFWASADRGGARCCTSGMYRCCFSTIAGGPLRTEGTSHVTESAATLYIRRLESCQEAQNKTDRHETGASCSKCE